ncbi:hypothetical protein Tco_0746915 [Tanacetum coccineum]
MGNLGKLPFHRDICSSTNVTTVVTRELLLIDLHELGRLNIYTRYGDTWAWVAQGPERQQATAAGAYEADEACPAAEEACEESSRDLRHDERKTRSNHGKNRPRESNASYSSTTLNLSSSSRPLDETIDVNYEESFHSNSSSPSQNVSSSSNVVIGVHQNPPHESHNLNTYLSETINLQTQQRDAHREGLRSIGQALKNMTSRKQK